MIYLLNLLLYCIYIIVILLISFIPGFAIAGHIKNLSVLEKLSISFGFSYLIIVLITPFFAFKLNFMAQLIFICIMIYSLLYLIKKRSELKFEINSRILISLLIIGLVLHFFLQTLWEYPVTGGDWIAHTLFIPYDFNSGNWTLPHDRTPFFNLLIFSYHNLLGTSLFQYWISQIISVVANTIFILPAFLIAKNVFNDKVAKISVAFMIITPWLIWQSIYTWPKNLAMYFTLLMVYFMFFKKDSKPLSYGLAGLFGALAFLTHNYTAFYILTALLAFIYVNKIHKHPPIILQEMFKEKFIYFFIVIVLTIVPYFLWMYASYGQIVTSRLLYYPFSVNGYVQASYDDPKEIFNTFFNTPISSIIETRISNAIVTLLPVALPINPIATNFPTYHPVLYYMQDYPGGLSFLMYMLVVIWFSRYIFRKINSDAVLVILVLVPFLVTLFIAGWKDWGLLTYALSPTVPILIMFGINELYKIRTSWIRNGYAYLMFIVCMIEVVIFGVLIKDLYLATGGIKHVMEVGTRVPGFQISSFISAHFLLRGYGNFLVNAVISLLLILMTINYLSKKES